MDAKSNFGSLKRYYIYYGKFCSENLLNKHVPGIF